MFTKTSDKSSDTTSTSRISLLNLFLLFIAMLQVSSQLLGLFFSAENEAEPSLLKVWLSLGNKMSENWVAISISLIFLVLGCFLYSSLSHKSSFPGNNVKSVGLLFINLALCLRVYSSSSVSEKIAYFATHLPMVIIVLIIVFFVTVGILAIQKEQKNTKELDRLIYGVSRESENEASTEYRGADNVKPDSDTRSDLETAFRLKHPFSYVYCSFAQDLEKKNEIKREHKKQMLQIKVEAERQKKNAELESLKGKNIIPENRGERIFGYLSAFLSFLICAGLVIFLFTQNSNGEGLEIIQRITGYILGIAGSLDAAKGPLTNFLLSSGVLFLFVILILTFFLLVYTTLRVIAYLLSHPTEDTKKIQRIGKAIKAFVLGILDGALRPLFFFPDFLKCLEEMLLDTDMDEKIGEIFSSADSVSESPKASASNTPDEK